MWGLPSDGRPSTLHEDQELRRFPELVGVGDLEAVARDLAVVAGRGGEAPHVLPRRDAVWLVVRERDLHHLGLVDRVECGGGELPCRLGGLARLPQDEEEAAAALPSRGGALYQIGLGGGHRV